MFIMSIILLDIVVVSGVFRTNHVTRAPQVVPSVPDRAAGVLLPLLSAPTQSAPPVIVPRVPKSELKR